MSRWLASLVSSQLIWTVSIIAEKISFQNRLVHGGTKFMKTHMGALSTLALLAVLQPNLFAQGNQPSRQEDPTAQAPATRAPATPPTFPTSEAKRQSDRPDV